MYQTADTVALSVEVRYRLHQIHVNVVRVSTKFVFGCVEYIVWSTDSVIEMSLCCSISVLLKFVLHTTVAGLLILIVGLPLLIIVARNYCRKQRESLPKDGGFCVGFFHPYCNAGGGGERVLWCAVKAMQARYAHVKIVVYTGDSDATPKDILKLAEQRFNIKLIAPVQFVYLRRRRWVEADMYPYFTLLGQSLGSIVLGAEALAAFVPDLYIDTMGYAFTLPIFKLIGGCNVACYVHYPTITGDMLRRVSGRVIAHNNHPYVARSPFLTAGKLLYYRLFAWLYGWVGRCSDIVMVNSSWTEEHISDLWQCSLKTHRVYPPCDVEELKQIPLLSEGSNSQNGAEHEEMLKRPNDFNKKTNLIKIVSVGQFRPEKDHPLQLRAMHELRQLVSEDVWDNIMLVFVGSCRNKEDQDRVRDMQDLCKHLSLENNVQFRVNINYDELKRELQEGMIGLHAMWNEHFGIGVVECMAAGLIMVAHRSGGPLMDIIVESEGSQNGFLATDEADYAMAIATILKLSPHARKIIRDAARASVDRFSVEEFEKGFLRVIHPFSHRMCTET
ncbi:GDP-Man:Man(3)GlcNAc(2)-PP-Dol alpha-1,2-mannosyltransferase isoform X2 [Cryptotermes secundus]|uniref:GDP-Man:Man(3)GlcNAc(2)-PP-Dol alpha-1,2-mannosyltransferase isoform X2 n=1 Tax=Cryptotermes secundus TaxID=105785 RepID=UPI000CD7C8A3|nr:GDP-Man:Man(3)GlcNAc(2)-PP-Dol alpha-1,2-mannosyltransferase isoform X2 [Cryptotermes secundus]